VDHSDAFAGVESPSENAALTKTILVVEDNELNMRLFNDLLSAHGYKVLKAMDGSAGLELTRQHRPDLIVMDVQLPGGLSGLDVTRSLKDDDVLKAIPVIAVTAFAMKGDDKKILAAGCDAYMPKPISAMRFLESIKGFLN
jgi:two-component system cell cycle response regulator DivK